MTDQPNKTADAAANRFVQAVTRDPAAQAPVSKAGREDTLAAAAATDTANLLQTIKRESKLTKPLGTRMDTIDAYVARRVLNLMKNRSPYQEDRDFLFTLSRLPLYMPRGMDMTPEEGRASVLRLCEQVGLGESATIEGRAPLSEPETPHLVVKHAALAKPDIKTAIENRLAQATAFIDAQPGLGRDLSR